MAETAFSIDTGTRERTYFLIDDVEYYIKATDEISRKEEGEFRILLNQDQKLSDRMNTLKLGKDDAQLERVVVATRKVRKKLTMLLSNVPEDVCERLTSLEMARIFTSYGVFNDLPSRQQEEETGEETADDIMDSLEEVDEVKKKRTAKKAD